MLSLAENTIDLFGATLPSLDDIRKLGCFVNAGEKNQMDFDELLGQKTDQKEAFGIGQYILGRYTSAASTLEGAQSSQGQMVLGWTYEKLGRFEDAIAAYDAAQTKGEESLNVTLAKAGCWRMAGELEKAQKELSNCANLNRVSSEYHYQMGRLCDATGEYEEAVGHYEIAVEIDSHHPRALFHLAYACDLRGDEKSAMNYYKQITSGSPVFVNALLNLSVLYEDLGEYDKASHCVEVVLDSHPNHPKAGMFLRDIDSSRSMIYDEEKEKRLDKQNKILEIPITDFELSVRSRNCLRKMNIRTLGDLLRITEAELLSYKNFGETSLNEIKKILDTKSLSLGMAIQDKPAAAVAKAQLPEGADDSMLSKPVDDLELSVRSRRCLSRLGVRTIGDLVAKTEAELLGCKNFGVTSLNEIKDRLVQFNLNLRTLD